MARSLTADERAAIADGHHNVHAKLELTDPDGAWVDISTGLDGGSADWFNGATLEDDVDANCMTMAASLLRDKGVESLLSLSPLREDSTLNRDALNAYAPFLDVGRSWRASVAVVLHGVTPAGGDWKEIGAGIVDVIDIDDPSPTIPIRGRDWGATLLDRFIDTVRTYSPDSDESMEDVIQQMLDDNLGAAEITLETPVSPLFVMNAWEQQADESLMSAVNRVARLAGMVVRYRYDASNVARLTLYAPDRSAGPGDEDWELGPEEYTALPNANIDLSGVRNRIIVNYYDETANDIDTVDAEDAASITRYGGPHAIPRVLTIDLAKETNVTSSTRAQDLADTVLSDLFTPPFLQLVEAPAFWIPQLGDFGKFLANGVHYDTDQYGGVTHLTFKIGNGTLKTTIRAGGQPRGKYRTWVTAYSPPGPGDLATLVMRGKIQSTTSTQVVIRLAVADMVAGNGDVEVTYAGVGVGVLSPASPETLAAADITDDLDTTDFVDITVPRPAFSAGTGRVTFVAHRNGRVTAVEAVDVPAVERDTIALLCRAKVQSTTATQVVVRVAVANPHVDGEITIDYVGVGVSTISPASGVVLVEANITDDIDTTATADFTIDRQAYNTGTGRVTFTASANNGNRTSATDAVEVPALEQNNPGSLALETAGDDVIANFAGPNTANSFQYAVSASAIPSDGDVASGTTNNNRVGRITFSGVVPDLGDRYYMKGRFFTATAAGGIGGPYITSEVERQNKTKTKTIRFPWTVFTPTSDNTDWQSADNGLTNGSAVSNIFRAGVVMPKGVEMTALRTRMGRANGDGSISAELKSIDDAGATSSIATNTHSTTGNQTQTTVISEVVSASLFYLIRLTIDTSTATNPQDNGMMWCEIDYVTADLENNY